MTNLVSIITAIHLAALSQVESGDQDAAVGAQGEVSRYQMMPGVVSAALEKHPDLRGVRLVLGWETDAPLTRRIALSIWQRRLINFQMVYQRSPTLPELYLCWHRPGRVIDPTRAEFERGLRFGNVVRKLDGEGKPKRTVLR